MEQLKISRQWLYLISRVLGLSPKKVIVNGKANNDYSKEQLERIRRIVEKK
jgi:hypothetical protein